MNSILQCLSHTPPLTDQLLKSTYTKNINSSSSMKGKLIQGVYTFMFITLSVTVSFFKFDVCACFALMSSIHRLLKINFSVISYWWHCFLIENHLSVFDWLSLRFVCTSTSCNRQSRVDSEVYKYIQSNLDYPDSSGPR